MRDGCTNVAPLDPVDVYPGTFVKLVVELLFFAFCLWDCPGVNCHLGICARGTALG